MLGYHLLRLVVPLSLRIMLHDSRFAGDNPHLVGGESWGHHRQRLLLGDDSTGPRYEIRCGNALTPSRTGPCEMSAQAETRVPSLAPRCPEDCAIGGQVTNCLMERPHSSLDNLWPRQYSEGRVQGSPDSPLLAGPVLGRWPGQSERLAAESARIEVPRFLGVRE